VDNELLPVTVIFAVTVIVIVIVIVVIVLGSFIRLFWCFTRAASIGGRYNVKAVEATFSCRRSRRLRSQSSTLLSRRGLQSTSQSRVLKPNEVNEPKIWWV
jgi:hypothetical protein